MASMAEIVEAPVDWIGALGDVNSSGLRLMTGQSASLGFKYEVPGLDYSNLAAGVAAILLEPDFLVPPKLHPTADRMLRLKDAGLTLDQIAQELNMDVQDVADDLRSIQNLLLKNGFALYQSAESIKPFRGVSRLGGPNPELVERVRKFRIGDAFLQELHDLLCTPDRYQDERANLLKEYKAGQSTFAASVAAILAPYLGGGVQVIAAATAVALSIIGQVGLKAWCTTRTHKRDCGRGDQPNDSQTISGL